MSVCVCFVLHQAHAILLHILCTQKVAVYMFYIVSPFYMCNLLIEAVSYYDYPILIPNEYSFQCCQSEIN